MLQFCENLTDPLEVYLRELKDQPPSTRRTTSPYDLEARYSTKPDLSWTGYKAHLTDTCDEALPIFINMETR